MTHLGATAALVVVVVVVSVSATAAAIVVVVVVVCVGTQQHQAKPQAVHGMHPMAPSLFAACTASLRLDAHSSSVAGGWGHHMSPSS